MGIDTNQLLEIRKLEDRQAEEWKALNLPKINNVSKNSTTRSNNASLKLKRAEFQATNDPNLEIALALSASMAGTTVDDSNALKSEKVEEINDESGKQCWLPQVISRSAHRTPNFMNPEYFVCLLFEYFFQIKVLN